MSEEHRSAGEAGIGTGAASVPAEQAFPDEHTTVPNPPEAPAKRDGASGDGKWQMPKPKFQQTSGYLPQGYLKKVSGEDGAGNTFLDDEVETAQLETNRPAAPEPAGAAVVAPAPSPAMPLVEPQPDLADQLIPEETAAQPSAPAKTTKPKPTALMFALGLTGIIFVVAIFIAVVLYFTWWAK